jgi:hypothetical protein
VQIAPPQLARPERVRVTSTPALSGAGAAIVTAVVLFTRFGFHGMLSRDESIYAYGGQQLVKGVPPYTSIFDPKAPLATLLSGLGAGLSRLFGHSELIGIRLLFFLLSLLAVLAIYLLALQLWNSVPGALLAGVAFASFYRFASDALGGPDAKTAALFPIVMAMYYAARRQWLRSGLFGSIALLVWQPFALFVLVTLVLALVQGDAVRGARSEPVEPAGPIDPAESLKSGESGDSAESADPVPADEPGPAGPPAAAGVRSTARRPHWRAFGRAVLGAIIPVGAVAIYFAAAGAWSDLVEAAIEFPATGVKPPQRTFGDQVSSIVSVVKSQYRFSAMLFWAGTVLLVLFVVGSFVRHRKAPLAALADPVVCVVALAWALQAGYMLYDFEGGPDVFPVLPAPALCIGGLFALAVREFGGPARRVAAGITLAAAFGLASVAWVLFAVHPVRTLDPNIQIADACALRRTLTHDGRLWVFGDPVPLVLTGRTNPDRFVYLGEGVADWKLAHTPGGLDGWMGQVAAVHPDVVLISDWGGNYALEAAAWLRAHEYTRYFLGTWKVFLLPIVRTEAIAHGVLPTGRPTEYAIDEDGAEISTRCGLPRVG